MSCDSSSAIQCAQSRVRKMSLRIGKDLKSDQDVVIRTQFGAQILRLKKGKTLCVPATKEVVGD